MGLPRQTSPECISTPIKNSEASAVKAILKGNYENLPEAYEKAKTYISDNNLIVDPAQKMFEVYTNDPGQFPNPADWVTEVYIPVFKDLRSNHSIISGE